MLVQRMTAAIDWDSLSVTQGEVSVLLSNVTPEWLSFFNSKGSKTSAPSLGPNVVVTRSGSSITVGPLERGSGKAVREYLQRLVADTNAAFGEHLAVEAAASEEARERSVARAEDDRELLAEIRDADS